jgi:hypothetical protein
VDGDDVAETDPDVCTDDPVDSGHAVVEVLVGEGDQHRVLSFLSLDEDGVALEEAECFHCV